MCDDLLVRILIELLKMSHLLLLGDKVSPQLSDLRFQLGQLILLLLDLLLIFLGFILLRHKGHRYLITGLHLLSELILLFGLLKSQLLFR